MTEANRRVWPGAMIVFGAYDSPPQEILLDKEGPRSFQTGTYPIGRSLLNSWLCVPVVIPTGHFHWRRWVSFTSSGIVARTPACRVTNVMFLMSPSPSICPNYSHVFSDAVNGHIYSMLHVNYAQEPITGHCTTAWYTYFFPFDQFSPF